MQREAEEIMEALKKEEDERDADEVRYRMENEENEKRYRQELGELEAVRSLSPFHSRIV